MVNLFCIKFAKYGDPPITQNAGCIYIRNSRHIIDAVVLGIANE